jgi:sugar phosphate isomerase/epimerase
MKRPLILLGLGLALVTPLFAEDVPAAGSFKGQAGLQLYSLREDFKKDVPGTLDKVKALGVKEVEIATTYTFSPEEYRKMLTDRGLEPISGHFQYDALKKDLAGQIKVAKAVGLKFMVVPWIPHSVADFTVEDVHRAAADFNEWGEAMKKEGITFGYHPHGYEFRPNGSDGTMFDLLVKETKPEFVTFEMDVFWVTHPGKDPVKLLEQYPNRWQLMHLKDMRKGAPTGFYTGHAPLTDDVPLGTGQVNWPAVLSTAAKVGVKHYFIEDESPTVEEALPKSLAYLRSLQPK